MKFQEIEAASGHFKICPKCNSREGFWLGLKRECFYVQCKCCGSVFDLFEIYRIGEEGAGSKRLRILRKG